MLKEKTIYFCLLLSIILSYISNICALLYVIIECIEINCLCKHGRKVRSSQASISKIFILNWVNHSFRCEYRLRIYSRSALFQYSSMWFSTDIGQFSTDCMICHILCYVWYFARYTDDATQNNKDVKQVFKCYKKYYHFYCCGLLIIWEA